MLHLKIGAVAIAAAMVTGVSASAQDHAGMVLMPNASSIQWHANPPGLPKGTEIAVLAGDPAKPGPFVLRVKFQANAMVPPHRHATAENLTILSGDLYHGMGETLDKAHGDRLETGGFVFLPPMMPHSVWAGPAGSVVQVTGTGPFGLLYVRPSDDPNPAP